MNLFEMQGVTKAKIGNTPELEPGCIYEDHKGNMRELISIGPKRVIYRLVDFVGDRSHPKRNASVANFSLWAVHDVTEDGAA